MKMRLLQGQYFNEQHLGGPGRVPAGSVLDVDDATALRWKSLGIARKANSSAPTFQEIRLAERLETMDERYGDEDGDEDDETEDEPNEDVGVFNTGVTRAGTATPPAPKPRRGRPAQGQGRPAKAAGQTKTADASVMSPVFGDGLNADDADADDRETVPADPGDEA